MSFQKKTALRLAIFPKDIQLITGRSYSASADLLVKIRKTLGKSRHQFITIKEFCEFAGFEEDSVRELIGD